MRVPIPPLRRTIGAAAGLVSGTAQQLTLGALDTVLASRLTDEAIERVSVHVLESPELERLVARAIDSPATERLVLRVIDSDLLDRIVCRLLEREELWLAVEEIARSPAVTEAMTQQSLSFTQQLAADARRGSSDADAWLERVARRVRRPRHGDEDSLGGPAPAPAG